MKEAQRFPADFNGIIAGAPGLDWTGRAASAVRIAQRLEQNEAARLGQAQRQLLHAAVVESCDLLDGVKDGVLENPKRCTFDPGVLECKGSEGGSSCLTTAQVETARMIYSGAVNPKTKRAINGLAHGSELGWTDLDGRHLLERRAWINSGFSSSAIRAGPYRSSTGIPTSCSPRNGTTTR